jgi:aspartyl-tRNA(Asn)/glutamyl-tRNA(Gln) amidotransferase subunit A
VVQRLLAAGAVPVATAHLSEWAIGGTNHNASFGAALNPWDRTRVTGGSSGGSAAAVQIGLCLGALGTDTGGSVRLPAALCGVSGLRPTRGRVSDRGSLPAAPSFDTVGPLARRVEDLALLMSVIAEPDVEEPDCVAVPVPSYLSLLTGDLEGLRVALLIDLVELAEPALAARIMAAAVALRVLGAEVLEVPLQLPDGVLEALADMTMAEAAAFHAERRTAQPPVLAPDILVRLSRADAVDGGRYGRARQLQREVAERVARLLRSFDVLVSPTTPTVAPMIAGTDPAAATAALNWFVGPFVLTEGPALSVPCGFVDGLPVGLQLIGRPFDDEMVLAVGHAYQQTTAWHLTSPT